MRVFQIDKSSKIVLYGVSQFLPDMAGSLRESGFQIQGYFDRNARMLKENLQYPVWTIEDAPFTNAEKEQICVIVCLQNCHEHGLAARRLYRHGYEKILFLPDDSPLEERQAGLLREKYNQFLHRAFEELNQIPCYSDLGWKAFKASNAVIMRRTAFLTVWVPLELVYSFKDNEEKTRYDDKNVILLKPYFELFRYFEGKESTVRGYFDYFSQFKNAAFDLTNGIDEKYLQKRYRLYCQFETEFNRGMSFFIESAPPAKWNPKGYFNLLDGHHRVVYLVEKGLWFLPLQVCEDDFFQWNGGREENDLYDGFMQMDCPVSLPAFVFAGRPQIQKLAPLFTGMACFMEETGWTAEGFLEISPYNAFFARYFARWGCRELGYVYPNMDEKAQEAVDSLNKLLHTDKIIQYSFDNLQELEFSRYQTIFISGCGLAAADSRPAEKIQALFRQNRNVCLFLEFHSQFQTAEGLVGPLAPDIEYRRLLIQNRLDGKVEFGVILKKLNQ